MTDNEFHASTPQPAPRAATSPMAFIVDGPHSCRRLNDWLAEHAGRVASVTAAGDAAFVVVDPAAPALDPATIEARREVARDLCRELDAIHAVLRSRLLLYSQEEVREDLARRILEVVKSLEAFT